jgi:exodeoxyribonuclease VII large subunit
MDDPRPPGLNATHLPEFTVSEISGAIKLTLEGEFGRVRVRGEITEIKRYPSGHIYCSLKDADAKLSGIIWRNSVGRLGLTPENGVEVIATGRISAYGERSSYQMIIERMEFAGAGALLARIEALRGRLAAEGLFDASGKLPLPMLPQVIGVVTSEHGAVIQDIRATILRRFPRNLLVWPAAVQGEGAARQIADAITGFDALPASGPVPRPDVLIVARGGGSLEDLMAFNEEIVLRAVVACRIPLISAVGHETDTTLIDFVSDHRAPTPTAAAEMAIPARADLLADVAQKATRLAGALAHVTRERRLRLLRAERLLPDLPSLLGTARQGLDDRSDRLAMALPHLLERRRAAIATVDGRLPNLPSMLVAVRERVRDRSGRLVLALSHLVTTRSHVLGLAEQRLFSGLRQGVGAVHQSAGRILIRLTDEALRARSQEARARLGGTVARLESVSPLAVLDRGYALVTDPAGVAITRAAGVKPGTKLRLRFADGEVRVTADGGRPGDRQGILAL